MKNLVRMSLTTALSSTFLAASACVLTLIGAQSAFAQAKPAVSAPNAAKPHRPGRMETMVQALGLSDSQKTKLMAINKDSGAKRKSINDALLTADDRKKQLKALDDSTRAQMSTVLTPAQRTRFAQAIAAQKAARAGAQKKP